MIPTEYNPAHTVSFFWPPTCRVTWKFPIETGGASIERFPGTGEINKVRHLFVFGRHIATWRRDEYPVDSPNISAQTRSGESPSA